MDWIMCFELQTATISGRRCCNVSLLDCIVQAWWGGIRLTVRRHSSSYSQYLQSTHALLKLDNSSFIHFINYTGFQPETKKLYCMSVFCHPSTRFSLTGVNEAANGFEIGILKSQRTQWLSPNSAVFASCTQNPLTTRALRSPQCSRGNSGGSVWTLGVSSSFNDWILKLRMCIHAHTRTHTFIHFR